MVVATWIADRSYRDEYRRVATASAAACHDLRSPQATELHTGVAWAGAVKCAFLRRAGTAHWPVRRPAARRLTALYLLQEPWPLWYPCFGRLISLIYRVLSPESVLRILTLYRKALYLCRLATFATVRARARSWSATVSHAKVMRCKYIWRTRIAQAMASEAVKVAFMSKSSKRSPFAQMKMKGAGAAPPGALRT